jgi:hypothetical protein
MSKFQAATALIGRMAKKLHFSLGIALKKLSKQVNF